MEMSRRCNYFDSTNSSTNTWNGYTMADESSEILTWLSPLEPRIRHKEVQSCQVPGVGDWLLHTEVFQSWSDISHKDKSNDATLFCYGDPGAGKTYITSLVVDALGDRVSDQNAIVACFYFDFTAQREQSPINMLGSLLKQIVSGLAEIPEEVVKAYYKHKKVTGGRRPRLPEIQTMLQNVSTSQPTFICVDALDECVAEHRQVVLESLREIPGKSPGVRLFLAGRSYIRSEVQSILSETATFMEIKPNKSDIVTYILAKLEEDTNKDAMNASLRADILERVPGMVSEIFLVSRTMEAILREQKISVRRDRLNAMSSSEGVCDRMLSRIKAQDETKEKIGMAALMWVSHSERPLRVDELCHALAVKIGSADLDPESVPSIRALLSCCQGLLVVDKEASTVRLIHSTLQEYLSTCPNLFDRPHSRIAETCLTYLNFRRFKGLRASDLPGPIPAPLLGYSSVHWGAHAKRELSDCAKSLALKLFDDYDNHISVKFLLSDPDRIDGGDFPLFTGLHCASFFGIVEVVATLVEMKGCDVNQKDCVSNTPLIWAAKNGHKGAVELLLGRDDINPDKPDNRGQTPLIWAAEGGHAGVVKLLLRRDDVHPGRADFNGRTPLLIAARNGNEDVVKLLLCRVDANPDKPDTEGQTPLSWATRNGHEGIVKLLLCQEVNPNKLDMEGQTSPSWVAQGGYRGVVGQLLYRGAPNPNPNAEVETPFSGAAETGRGVTVNGLRKRKEIPPDMPSRPSHMSLTPYTTSRKRARQHGNFVATGRS